ncbi:MAG: SAM-dependent methyltransferase [Christensenellaceae bacterium]|nr:SAM-dependent methyltransferase [Christensenellaceae bacterium]MEA5070259.1 SAM-dependent methyltransferase [Christensenellaceae bacterium]
MGKPILDATCGGRMMWFDKHNPNVLYVDKREVADMRCCDNRRFAVNPDMLADFRALPFPDKSFKLVVFDPPHLVRVSDAAFMAVKYGKLPKDWQPLIRDGFHECMRVLDDYGTLIFKWSEIQIPTRQVIEAIGTQPLFGHISGRKSNTHWMTFMRGVS